MRKKTCSEEDVFAFVWNNADEDGMWEGNDQILAAAFGVTEDEAYEVLGELTDRNRFQRVGSETYIITAWREKDDPGEEEATC
jgi:hypothetical protein